MKDDRSTLILVVEDDPTAAALELEQLAAPSRELFHVKTLQAALVFCRARRPDLLLLDNCLPDGNAESLLDDLDILPDGPPPFIVVTGAGDEELAVAMMKRGARDYLVKNAQFLLQLPTVVSRVLRELDAHRQLARVQQELDQSRLEYQRLVENSPDVIARFDREGRYLFVNATVERYAGRPAVDFIGRSNEELGMPAHLCRQWHQSLERVIAAGGVATCQFSFDGPDGTAIFESRLIPECDEQGEIVTILGLMRDITQQQRAEQDAESRKRRLEVVFEASYAGIILVDRNGLILFANRRAGELFGASAGLVGMSYSQLVDPQQQAEGTQSMEQLIRGEIDHVLLERLYRRNDGSNFWGLLSGRRLCAQDGTFEALVGIITDISDRRSVELKLEESRQQLIKAQLIGNFHSYEYDLASGHIELADQSYALLERPAGSFATTIEQWFAFVHPDDRLPLRQAIERALAGTETKAEYRLLMPDGRYKPVITYGDAKRLADGTPVSIYGVTQDISERVAYEESLRQARDCAESANRAKSEFLANMSHELRTPLNGVLGMLQLLETTHLDNEQQEYIRTATSSGWSLLSLLNDILDLSRVEAGRLELRAEPFDIRELLDYCLLFFRQSAEEKRLSLGKHVSAAVPTVLQGDVVRLRQILFNLIGNAIKFTEQGGVRVELDLLDQPAAGRVRLRLRVADSGIGIGADMLQRVCEPFAQEEGPYQRRYQGAGLGLAIVRRLAGLMQGEVVIASRPGEGTEVSVNLELGSEQVLDPPVGTRPGSSTQLSDVENGLRLLVAEDNPVNRKTIVTLLQKAGHQVLAVGNGHEVLSALSQQPFDLLLLDVQMPGMDGLEALRLIRSDGSGRFDPRIPVVGVTAFTMAGDRETFLAAGMNACLDKPLHWRELEETIQRLVTLPRRDSQVCSVPDPCHSVN